MVMMRFVNFELSQTYLKSFYAYRLSTKTYMSLQGGAWQLRLAGPPGKIATPTGTSR